MAACLPFPPPLPYPALCPGPALCQLRQAHLVRRLEARASEDGVAIRTLREQIAELELACSAAGEHVATRHATLLTQLKAREHEARTIDALHATLDEQAIERRAEAEAQVRSRPTPLSSSRSAPVLCGGRPAVLSILTPTCPPPPGSPWLRCSFTCATCY